MPICAPRIFCSSPLGKRRQVLSPEADAPAAHRAAGPQQAQGGAQQRAFAAARFAHDPQDLPGAKGEAHIADHRPAAKGDLHRFIFQQRCHSPSSFPSSDGYYAAGRRSAVIS